MRLLPGQTNEGIGYDVHLTNDPCHLLSMLARQLAEHLTPYNLAVDDVVDDRYVVTAMGVGRDTAQRPVRKGIVGTAVPTRIDLVGRDDKSLAYLRPTLKLGKHGCPGFSVSVRLIGTSPEDVAVVSSANGH
jgi:hypothetical protein